CQVDVHLRRGDAGVSRVQRDVLQVNVAAFEDGEAQVPQRMGRQLRYAHRATDTRDDVVEGADGQGRARIALRLGEEQRSVAVAAKGRQEVRPILVQVARE